MSFFMGLVISLAAATDAVLVTPAELQGLTGAVIVDAREADKFAAGHIPGAANLDVDILSEERDSVINLLKPLDELRPILAAAGLHPDRTIVVYSGLEKESDLIRATRLFWALEYVGYTQVRLLDGGLARWKAEGGSVTQGESTADPVAVEDVASLSLREDRYADREEVLAAQAAKKGIIVDLRSTDLYTGKAKPDYVARGGHIAGAESCPAESLVEGEFFTFKGKDRVREVLAVGDQGTKTPVMTYCNSGRSATVGYVAYRIAGFEDVSVYDGSMAEWGNRTDTPIDAGEAN